MLPPSLDPARLTAALPRFRHYFRYPLHPADFHALRADDARLLGYYAAKPLYGRLDVRGRVDRSAGFNGDIVAIFVPSPARSWKRARLAHGRLPAHRVTRTGGRRNWLAIRLAAERAITRAGKTLCPNGTSLSSLRMLLPLLSANPRPGFVAWLGQ